jgi:hypothetical protein
MGTIAIRLSAERAPVESGTAESEMKRFEANPAKAIGEGRAGCSEQKDFVQMRNARVG